LLPTTTEPVLFQRLREHARSIEQVERHAEKTGQPNLRLSDFRCRYLVADDIWVPLGEALLIGHYQPIWNQVLQGFGNHDPGPAGDVARDLTGMKSTLAGLGRLYTSCLAGRSLRASLPSESTSYARANPISRPRRN